MKKSPSKAPGISRSDLLVTLAIAALGGAFLLLGGFSTQPGDQSAFTDEILGTLVSLPSQTTLYAIGAICFFIAGMRLYRGLTSLRSLLNWTIVLVSAFAFLIWVSSGTSMNLSGMLQATLISPRRGWAQ